MLRTRAENVLGKKFGKERLEAACERAVFIKDVSYTSIKSILANNLDQKPLPKQQEQFFYPRP